MIKEVSNYYMYCSVYAYLLNTAFPRHQTTGGTKGEATAQNISLTKEGFKDWFNPSEKGNNLLCLGIKIYSFIHVRKYLSEHVNLAMIQINLHIHADGEELSVLRNIRSLADPKRLGTLSQAVPSMQTDLSLLWALIYRIAFSHIVIHFY